MTTYYVVQRGEPGDRQLSASERRLLIAAARAERRLLEHDGGDGWVYAGLDCHSDTPDAIAADALHTRQLLSVDWRTGRYRLAAGPREALHEAAGAFGPSDGDWAERLFSGAAA